MLPRENRLKRMKDFDILFKEGRFVSGKLVNLKVWKIQPEKYPKRNYSTDDLKIGFIISNKVQKSAVRRNRIKRQLREVVRLILKEDGLKNGYMIAVLAKTEIIGKEYEEINQSVTEVLKRIGVLK